MDFKNTLSFTFCFFNGFDDSFLIKLIAMNALLPNLKLFHSVFQILPIFCELSRYKLIVRRFPSHSQEKSSTFIINMYFKMPCSNQQQKLNSIKYLKVKSERDRNKTNRKIRPHKHFNRKSISQNKTHY